MLIKQSQNITLLFINIQNHLNSKCIVIIHISQILVFQKIQFLEFSHRFLAL